MQTPKYLRILIVEDSEPFSRLLKIAFTKAGHDVTLETSVESALFALTREAYDALVCDLLLPDGNGCEIIQAARQKEMPMFSVAISGLLPAACEVKALAAGFDRFICKPFELSVLVGLFA